MGDSSRILVVDDSPTQADYLRGLLEERGYEVAVSRNGELALEAVRESHPGLIISDIVMPVMNGYDLCRAVKQDPALRDTPVMLVTTLDDPADLILGLNARADAYLTKPYSPEYLLSRVEALFSQTRSVESPRDPVEVTLRGHDYAVTSSRKQILELLVSTYENAIQQNHKLVETQLDLEALHKHLDRDRRLLRTLIDTLPDRIYIKDAQSRYILDNWAHLHFIGLSSTAEIVGKTAFDFFPAGIAEQYHASDAEIIRTGKPLLNLEEPSIDRAGNDRWVSTTKMPFRDSVGKVIGLICMSRDITDRKRAEEQLARYASELSRRNAQMEEDINMARELQQALLPTAAISFPVHAVDGGPLVRFEHRYIPSSTIGGDFFTVFPVSENEVGVIIGDVMGHGVRAALITAILRGLIEELKSAASDPGDFMRDLNFGLARVLRHTGIAMFASAIYLLINIRDGALRYANAGHPAPFRLYANGRTEPLKPSARARPDPALGVIDSAEYHSCETEMTQGERLLLFTDGLFEVEGPNDDFFDEHRLLQFVADHAKSGTNQLLDETLDAMRQFAEKPDFEDDVCVIGVEVLGLAPGPCGNR